MREWNEDNANIESGLRSPGKTIQGEGKKRSLLAREDCWRIVMKFTADHEHAQPKRSHQRKRRQNRKNDLQSEDMKHGKYTHACKC